MITHYDRYLPHILPPGETVFITFRLHGSLPKEVVDRLMNEQKTTELQIKQGFPDESAAQKQALLTSRKGYFSKFDTCLDTYAEGNHWLTRTNIVNIVKSAIHYHADRLSYELHAYCIMSNHVHLLVTIMESDTSFFAILKSLKSFTARKANTLLQRTGLPFWQPESYDHVIRTNQEYKNVIAYILNNPVKSGLAETWEDWPHSYWVERSPDLPVR